MPAASGRCATTLILRSKWVMWWCLVLRLQWGCDAWGSRYNLSFHNPCGSLSASTPLLPT